MKMTTLDWVTMILVVIGGLNWGLIGLINLDVVTAIFGSIPVLVQLIYIVVGLSALYMIYKAMMSK